MRLQNVLTRQGQFLFRWRSYIPLSYFILGLLIMMQNTSNVTAAGSADDLYDQLWDVVVLFVVFLGLLIRWITVGSVPAGTSGKNVHFQRADQLNTTGMYSIVRNPLYFGNFLCVLGLTLFVGSLWYIFLVILSYILYMERIIQTEECYLIEKYGSQYRKYCEKTPVFIPKWSLWRKNDLNFSIRTVLKREYNAITAVISLFFLFEFIQDVLLKGEDMGEWLFHDDFLWFILFTATIILFLVLRFLKKHTAFLHVYGR